MIGNLLSLIFPTIGRTIDKVIPDTNEARRLKAELAEQFMQNSAEFEKLHAELLKADQQSESALTRNIRPLAVLWAMGLLTMVIFGFGTLPVGLESKLFDLVTYGTMIYFGSRGVEKMTKNLSGGSGVLDLWRSRR